VAVEAEVGHTVQHGRSIASIVAEAAQATGPVAVEGWTA